MIVKWDNKKRENEVAAGEVLKIDPACSLLQVNNNVDI